MPTVHVAAAAARTAAGAVAATGGALALLVPLAAAPASAADTPRGREVYLTFEEADLRSTAGNADVDVSIADHNNGSLSTRTGNGGSVLRTPAYREAEPRFALLTAVDRTGEDILSPGTDTFTFGADFAIDEESQGADPDNGNNLIQRGLFGASLQYKIEVDRNRPSCRVAGDDGAVVVRSHRQVEPGVWHRVKCRREGSAVTLTVVRRSDGESWSTSEEGATGRLKADTDRLPLSVGGKTTARGEVVEHSSDQFNGLIDNAFYNVR